MEITGFIVDDEKSAREVLKHHLKQFPEIHILGESSNIDDAQYWLEHNEIDLLFLDISMPSGSGMDLLNKLRSRDFEVVFITAHSEYSIEAIRKSAFDYLLKPILLDELTDCISRFKSRIEEKEKRASELMIQAKEDSFVVHDKQGMHVVDRSKLIRVESEGNYSTLFMEHGKKVVVTKNIKKIHEEFLSDINFMRVHQSHIINVNFVKSFISKDKLIVLLNNDSVPLSRSNRSEFISIFKSSVS